MEEQIEKPVEKEINLRIVFGVLKKNLILILVFTILTGVGTYLFSRFLMEKQYSASAMLIVNNTSGEKKSYNATELVAAQDLAEVYSIIIKSDTVLQQVIDNLQLNMSYTQLNKLVSVTAVNKTQVFRVTMTYTDVDFARKVVDEIVKVSPPVIVDMVEAGSVKVVSAAKIDNNGNPISPNLKRNTVLGALAGLVLVLIYVFLKETLRNTFKTEDDILNTLHIPLIGVIPEVDGKEFTGP